MGKSNGTGAMLGMIIVGVGLTAVGWQIIHATKIPAAPLPTIHTVIGGTSKAPTIPVRASKGVSGTRYPDCGDRVPPCVTRDDNNVWFLFRDSQKPAEVVIVIATDTDTTGTMWHTVAP